MADDTVLTKPHAVALLQKLSTDDKFRASYAANAGKALLKLGVPQATVNSMPPGHSAKLGTLADKSAFAAALAQLKSGHADVCVCFHPPTVRLNIGKR